MLHSAERSKVPEATGKKKAITLNLKARARVPGLEIELSAPSRSSDLDTTLSSLLTAVESQAERIISLGKIFGQPPSALKAEGGPSAVTEDPYSRIAADLGVTVDELRSSKLIGFKEGKPQIMSPARFPSPEKGCLVLFYAFEIGLDRSPITFEDGEEAYHMSRYTEPFAGRVLNNLKQTNKINRSKYDAAHEIVLTPSGIEDAREVLKAALTGGSKPTRRPRKARRKMKT